MANIAPVEMSTTKHPGQRSTDWSDAYLARFIPTWNRPTFSVDAWRNVVRSQQVATICRDTIINRVLSLDWKIVPRDSSMQDELRGVINHYSRLFEKSGYGGDLDYTSHVEWIMEDLLDGPFGGCSEIGRKDNNPNGRVVWIKPLDSNYLYPTMNFDYPVAESYQTRVVAFPKEFVSRVIMSPVKTLTHQGWSVAPPEKIFMALQMISQGDGYYANLLLDIPSVGILDLGDMERSSAEEWVKAYQSMLVNGPGQGPNAFRIPVLYEHNTDVKFIPFGKVPNDIMYDSITGRYMSLVCAGYGITLADIGLGAKGSGGDTLAGAIRSERISNKNGFSLAKKKWTYYANQILPPTLRWTFIDYDDEHLLNIGRARLATATAMAQLKDKGFISEDEGRQQMMADGLFTISMPEHAPGISVDKEMSDSGSSRVPERPGMVGSPVHPSAGGYGEIRSLSQKAVSRLVDDISVALHPALSVLRSTSEDTWGQVRKSFPELVDDVIGLLPVPKSTDELTAEIVWKFVANELQDVYLNDGLDVELDVSYDDTVSTIKEKAYGLFSTHKEK